MTPEQWEDIKIRIENMLARFKEDWNVEFDYQDAGIFQIENNLIGSANLAELKLGLMKEFHQEFIVALTTMYHDRIDDLCYINFEFTPINQ